MLGKGLQWVSEDEGRPDGTWGVLGRDSGTAAQGQHSALAGSLQELSPSEEVPLPFFLKFLTLQGPVASLGVQTTSPGLYSMNIKE